MPTLLIRVGAAILLAATAVVASAVPGVDPAAAPHPPAVAAASDDPVHAAAGFGLPEGFLVELFAAEPDVANPVAFSVDAGNCLRLRNLPPEPRRHRQPRP